MNRIIKWIGGAAAGLGLILGGATLARDMLNGGAGKATGEIAGNIEPNSARDDTASANSDVADLAANAAAKPQAAVAEAQAAAAKAENEPFIIKRILPIEGAIKYGEWHWDDAGVPDGPLVMTVDLDARVLSVFRGGYEIGAAAVLLGTDEHPTPLGTFPILTKERHNISEKYGNAPMPWTLRLTWDGIAIHGGSTVENGYASHGCIGSPDEFIAKIYAIAKKGDKVIITRGKMIGMGDSIL